MPSYNPGHPWYYLLGGSVPTPKQIRQHVCEQAYRGYRQQEIEVAACKPEPERSTRLRRLHADIVRDFRCDLSRYRTLACKLHRLRRQQPLQTPQLCDDIHTGISLKYCHLFNDFAHMLLIDALLQRQPDLFG